jgi:predicted O-methyltransferase YrrM
MAAHGYLNSIKRYLQYVENPSVIEIGVDRGVMFLTLAYFLVRTKQKFDITGVDIMVQEQLAVMAANIDLASLEQKIRLYQENSLSLMPKITEEIRLGNRKPFDVMLIDGDHNYYTVQKELSLLNDLTHENSIVIIDDYAGRWSERDLHYFDRPEYVNCKIATPKVDTEKHGVRPAVDEFLDTNLNWKTAQPINGEPVVLFRNRDAFMQMS